MTNLRKSGMHRGAVSSTGNAWSSSAAAAALIKKLLTLPQSKRYLVAIAGAPGSGKSTLGDHLAHAINSQRPAFAAVVPMDGFHLDDAVLREKGSLARKGAPFTFDTGGMLALLKRLKANTEAEIAVPLFDRSLEISRAGARMIPQTTPLILIEGNYLLLDQQPWSEIRGICDLTVFLVVPLAELERRLVRRWLDHGYAPAEAVAKAAGNDLTNARLVQDFSVAADFILAE